MSTTVWYLEYLWDWNENSAVATIDLFKFAGILSSALSQPHLLEFEIAQLEFHYFH